MKRSAVITILGCILGLVFAIFAGAQTSTQSHTQKKAAPSKVQQPAAGDYKELKRKDTNDRPIKALWYFTRKEPCPDVNARQLETAKLLLDDARYREFRNDPRFLNNYKLFSCDFTRMERLSRTARLSPARAASAKNQVFSLTVNHEPDCGGVWYEY